MIKGKHGKNERPFEELTFAGQASAINGEISRLTAAIKAHLRKAEQDGRDRNELLSKKIAQISRIITNITR